jgi:hypothetical protein
MHTVSIETELRNINTPKYVQIKQEYAESYLCFVK